MRGQKTLNILHPGTRARPKSSLSDSSLPRGCYSRPRGRDKRSRMRIRAPNCSILNKFWSIKYKKKRTSSKWRHRSIGSTRPFFIPFSQIFVTSHSAHLLGWMTACIKWEVIIDSKHTHFSSLWCSCRIVVTPNSLDKCWTKIGHFLFVDKYWTKIIWNCFWTKFRQKLDMDKTLTKFGQVILSLNTNIK